MDSGSLPMDDYESLISTTDIELLKKAWRNEKAAPEILRFEIGLIQRTRGQTQLMEETVDEISAGDTDPLTGSYIRVRIQMDYMHMYLVLMAITDENFGMSMFVAPPNSKIA